MTSSIPRPGSKFSSISDLLQAYHTALSTYMSGASYSLPSLPSVPSQYNIRKGCYVLVPSSLPSSTSIDSTSFLGLQCLDLLQKHPLILLLLEYLFAPTTNQNRQQWIFCMMRKYTNLRVKWGRKRPKYKIPIRGETPRAFICDVCAVDQAGRAQSACSVGDKGSGYVRHERVLASTRLHSVVALLLWGPVELRVV